MRYREEAQEWVHSREEEACYGMEMTAIGNMPPSLRKLLESHQDEASRLRSRLGRAIALLEDARRIHVHDTLGERILAWLQVRPM